MITLLLDLDDTLLETNMGTFLPAYYEQLSTHLRPLVPPEAMLTALRSGVRLMAASEDSARTLREVFEGDFYPKLGVRADDLRQSITHFYERVFPSLVTQTRQRRGARELIDWAMAAGHRLALATDPLFPMRATKERIRWAGLDPSCFDLISSFESFHFSKSHAAYFAEMMGRLGWPEGTVVMAGNDVQRDLIPARQLGLLAFHVNGSAASVPGTSPGADDATANGGSLFDLRTWLAETPLEAYSPRFRTKDAIMAVLEATPAALTGLAFGLSAEEWKDQASPDDWAMIELACHLRDTEREVHQLQIQTLLESEAPFIARPDAAVWAKQRKYLGEDGPASLREFASARMAVVQQLKSAPAEIWQKGGRHAIFGPTTFLEAVGFIADHDRMHVRQAWNTLRRLQVGAHRN